MTQPRAPRNCDDKAVPPQYLKFPTTTRYLCLLHITTTSTGSPSHRQISFEDYAVPSHHHITPSPHTTTKLSLSDTVLSAPTISSSPTLCCLRSHHPPSSHLRHSDEIPAMTPYSRSLDRSRSSSCRVVNPLGVCSCVVVVLLASSSSGRKTFGESDGCSRNKYLLRGFRKGVLRWGYLLGVRLRVDFCVRLFAGRELLHEESSWRDRFEEWFDDQV